MSYNKNLRLIKDTPRQIIYPTGLAEVIPGSWIQFQGGMFETEDEAEIAWLQKHRLFGQQVGVPGSFWVYVQPRNLEEELAQKDAELAELKEKLATTDSSKKADIKPPVKISGVPVMPTLDQVDAPKQ